MFDEIIPRFRNNDGITERVDNSRNKILERFGHQLYCKHGVQFESAMYRSMHDAELIR